MPENEAHPEAAAKLVERIQGVLQGNNTLEVIAACNYVAAGAIATIASDREHAHEIVAHYFKRLAEFIDSDWDMLRTPPRKH